MFALGIFVSPLPYAVLVAFYAFYMLLVHVNDAYDKQDRLANNPGKHLEIEDQSTSINTSTFFVASSDLNDSKNQLSPKDLCISTIRFDFTNNLSSEKPAYVCVFNRFLLSEFIAARPPPVV